MKLFKKQSYGMIRECKKPTNSMSEYLLKQTPVCGYRISK